MTDQTFDVVVAGAGANGLVAAVRLARAGRRVVVVDGAAALGGQSQLLEFAPGFLVPPLGLDPGWLPPHVAAAVGAGGLARVEVDTPLTVVAGPREFLTLSRDARRAAEAIGARSRMDAAKWPTFTGLLRNLAGFLEALYVAPAPAVDVGSPREALALLGLGRRLRALGRRDMLELLRTLPLSVWELLDDWFECGPLKAAVAAGGVQDLQQGPRSGGTGFVLLHHLVGAPPGSVRGRVPWRAGPAEFTRAVESVARQLGVTIRTGAPVAQVRVQDEAVTAVVLETGEEIAARSVLSTADPVRTLLDWIDPVWLDPEFVRDVGNVRHRGCTAFVLYALDSLPELPGLASAQALAGIVSLTGDVVTLERAADAAKYGEVPARPHVELTVPTLLWPDLAPAGRHVVVARVQYAPYRLRNGAMWDAARRDALGETVTSAIEEIAPGFISRIVHRAALSPRDLEERFALREGSPSHGELALDQILFMRPVAGFGRHVTPIAGLYLGGAGTHPGPGILGGSGWLAAERMLAQGRSAR